MSNFDKAIEIAKNGKRGELALKWDEDGMVSQRTDAYRLTARVDHGSALPSGQAFQYYLQLATQDFRDQVLAQAKAYAQTDVSRGKELLDDGLGPFEIITKE